MDKKKPKQYLMSVAEIKDIFEANKDAKLSIRELTAIFNTNEGLN